MATAAKDVLNTIRSKKDLETYAPETAERRQSNLEEDAMSAAKELKDELKRRQIGRRNSKDNKIPTKRNTTPPSELNLTDSGFSESPGTSRLDVIASSMTERSYDVSEGSSNDTTGSQRRSTFEEHQENMTHFPPYALDMERLRQRFQAEKECAADFLETIRVLRGVKKKDFYAGIEKETGIKKEKPKEMNKKPKKKKEEKNETPRPPELSSPEVTSQVQLEQVKVSVRNRNSDETMADSSSPPADKNNSVPGVIRTINVGCRIDSRWPKGHRFFTKRMAKQTEKSEKKSSIKATKPS